MPIKCYKLLYIRFLLVLFTKEVSLANTCKRSPYFVTSYYKQASTPKLLIGIPNRRNLGYLDRLNIRSHAVWLVTFGFVFPIKDTLISQYGHLNFWTSHIQFFWHVSINYVHFKKSYLRPQCPRKCDRTHPFHVAKI